MNESFFWKEAEKQSWAKAMEEEKIHPKVFGSSRASSRLERLSKTFWVASEVVDVRILVNLPQDVLIRYGYLLILGRPVDEAGYKNYQSLLSKQAITPRGFLHNLKTSQEGRDKNLRVLGLKRLWFQEKISQFFERLFSKKRVASC